MRTTEQTACALQGVKIRSPRTGIFATLRAHLPVPFRVHTQGTGAPSRLALAFALSLSALALTAAPALAETPETPELKVEPVFATIATFNGVLSPKALVPAEGSYKFLYKASPTECEGGSETTPGLALGGAPELLPPEQVNGLAPATEYTVCLQITNPSIETATSLPVTFKTAAAAPPEPPEATEVSERKATTATLNGMVNPLKEGEPGKYRFLYAQSASVCTGGLETTEEPAPGSPQPVLAAITGLEPGKPYTFCVKAFNALSEATLSAPRTFTAAIPPETPEKQPATEVTATSWNLHGVLNPTAAREFEPGTYEFLYKQSATECEGGQATPKEPAAGHLAEAVKAEVTGLLPTTTYTFCLRAENGAGEAAVGPPETFTTPTAAPTVGPGSASGVTATEATLSAQINPGGEPATYSVEYEPGKTTPAQSLPASTTPVEVQQNLTGLKPATEYHFRFLAQNKHGNIQGPFVAFTTPSQSSAGQALPDGRRFELVSPANSREVYAPPSEGITEEDISSNRPYRAAADGSAVTYAAEPPVSGEGGNGSEGQPFGNEYLSTRGAHAGASGWETSDITPLARNVESEYEAFSPDLSVGVFYDPNKRGSLPTLAEDAPSVCNGLYARTAAGFGALFRTADVQKAGFCGGERAPMSAGGNEGTASTPAYSQLLFQTGASLSPESVEAPGEGQYDLYDSAGGAVKPINVVAGKPAPSAVFGGPAGPQNGTPGGQDGNPALDNVISADGSRVFWSTVKNEAGEDRPTALYVREDPTSPGARTVQLDEAEPGAAGPSGEGRFWAASSDGSRVFFTDCNRLVEGSTADNSEACWHGEEERAPILKGQDLYEYDFAKPAGHRLTDLTIDHTDVGGADVQGVLGASADGETIYFVADGVLAANPNPRNETATAGQPNLYVLHHGTTPTFITTLLPTDNHLQGFAGQLEPAGDWRPSLGVKTAQVTRDGSHLVFESRRALTGYDNSGIVEANNSTEIEVFLYDAAANRLSCVSCSPTGAHVVSGPHNEPGRGTYVPVSLNSTFMRRWINESGTEIFFNTGQPLVPWDTNGHEDVYEWEREGNGSCPTGEPGGGCVYLLTGGTSSDQSLLADASANGSDVFFTTRAQLVPQDRDDVVDLYDARVNGGLSEAALACTGTSCQGVPPSSPSFATPPSVTFGGTGNYPPAVTSSSKPKTAAQIRAERLARALKTCRVKHPPRRRKACEALARKRYGSPRAARSAAHRQRHAGHRGGRP